MNNVLSRKVGVRWTLGDVGPRGYEALRLSIWGAYRIFGDDASYAVCVNSVPLGDARERTGGTPLDVVWHDASGEMPPFLSSFFDEGMAEGVGWKLAPLRFFPDRYELSLDNDCILWSMPDAMREWLAADEPARCLMAQDVKACFGQFEDLCGPDPCNAGIRGLPPGFDFEASLRQVLASKAGEGAAPLVMSSELDEQGLQTAALSTAGRPLLVTTDQVTICSPFWPHIPNLGTHGAHFVGLNARHIPWNYYDRPADEWMAEHWSRLAPELYNKVGLERPG